MYTMESLTLNQKADVNKLPEEHRQMVIDLYGAANAEAEAERETIRIVINEVNADGKPSKGAVQIYGLGRFPISLHIGQCKKLIGVIPDLQKFINDPANVEKSTKLRAAFRVWEKAQKAAAPTLTVAK